jgi:hypothetical protein
MLEVVGYQVMVKTAWQHNIMHEMRQMSSTFSVIA